MRRLPILFAALLAPVLAAAADGAAPAAGVVPADGTVEASVRESLRLLRSGQVDQWIADWCDTESLCRSSGLEELKRYGLARGQKDAKMCLHGADDAIIVSRLEGDPATDETVKVFVQCDERTMPVPSTMKKIDGKWKVTSFSW